MILMDALSQTIVMSAYVDKESYHNAYPLFTRLKEQGLNPYSVTTDGHLKIIEAFKSVWPNIIIQRCLYHIQRQGLSWLRMFPKTQAAWELRRILLILIPCKEQNDFINAYDQWFLKHKNFVQLLPSTTVAFKDLKRTMSLIQNAIPNMYHFLKNHLIQSTTNKLESFYSRLKADIRRHRGLSEKHKIAYLNWYCYFKNQSVKINNL